MGDLTGAAQMLEVYARKCEEFLSNVENKHMVWLREIEEEARRMFSSDFNAEPELMPKTPSQKRRRKKGRQSGVMEENNSTRQRLSRRSNNWCSSVRRLSMKLQDAEAAEPTLAVEDAPRATRQTRAQAQKAVSVVPENSSVKTTEHALLPSKPFVRISKEDRQSAHEVLEMVSTIEEMLPPMSEDASHHKETQPPNAFLKAPQTPDGTCRIASKVKIASSTPEKAVVEINGNLIQMDKSPVQDGCLNLEANDAQAHVVQEADALPMDLSAVFTEERTAEISNSSAGKGTPTGSKSDRRSVRRSLVDRSSRRHSLRAKYSLASRRESMTREAMRKSIRRSISKKAWESSASSCHSSTDGVEDDAVKGRPEPTPNIAEIEERESPQRSLRSRNARKIAISNEVNDAEQPSLQRATCTAKNGDDKENMMETEMEAQSARRKSYKRAVDSLYDMSYEQCSDDAGQSPPRKKTPSPPCPSNKVVRPPAANMRTFLHTVQKNQFLMSTPGSSSSRVNIKSFIKRTTPLKSDNKGDFVEKERQRLEALRRKQEAEIQRKQKMEEEKKRKLEELKLRREERQRKVLQARERVEQIGEEKKRKIEQKFAQIDEKSEKVKEDRLAEEKAKKKLTAKKMEEVEVRRRQDEEARRQKIQQMEEEEQKHQEMMQKKREEEEQERSKKIAETKKLTEQRQAELERERQREQQAAAEKDLERKRDLERVLAEKERERHEKEKVLQQQREQEKAAREEAAAQEKERVWKETEERKRKEQQEWQEKMRKEFAQERRAKEETLRAKEEQDRLAKEEQERIAKENLTAASKALNVTLEVTKSPASESYKMTPQNSNPKPPKICGDNYGMDLNSDDSTDDESEPRKPIPSWASGKLLNDILRQQFYNPINEDRTFGGIDSPKLEEMFYKNKPRYIKRTSSAVWHSPPMNNYRSVTMPYSIKKY